MWLSVTICLLVVFVLLYVNLYIKLTWGLNKCSRHLVGKTVVVTGASSGIGLETARDLAARGARVIIACNNQGQGPSATHSIIQSSGNPDVHHRYLDLASFASVRAFAKDVIDTETRLDILINNAGVIDFKNVTTVDGISQGMQINHFGPFLLTNLLLPLLKSTAPSRIINVSSTTYRYGVIDFDNFEKLSDNKFSVMGLYNTTKLCNVLMTLELDRLLTSSGVTCNCLHPGMVGTSIVSAQAGRWLPVINIFKNFVKNPWQGAQTSIHLAVSPEVKEVSGQYFSDCRVTELNKKAKDLDLAKKVWEASVRIVQLE